jgi:hypothetical protein
VHDVAHLRIGRRGEELAERDHAEQPLVGGEHIGVVDDLDSPDCLPTQVADRHLHRDIGTEPHVPGVHDPAGRILGVSQQGAHLPLHRGIEQVEEGLAFRRLELLNHVRGIVGREQAKPGAAPFGPELPQQIGLIPAAEGEEEIRRGIGAEQGEPFQPLLRAEDRVRVQQRLGRESVRERSGQESASGLEVAMRQAVVQPTIEIAGG